jgi:VanZ family protein
LVHLPSESRSRSNEIFLFQSREMTDLKILVVLCLLVFCCIMIAGLWPFHAPKNRVKWIGDANGLVFESHGTVVSARAFQTPDSPGVGPGSLEIWLQPSRREAAHTFLAFDNPSNPLSLLLYQYRSDLILRRERWSHMSHKLEEAYVENVFRERTPVFVTITSEARGTAVYIDGALVKVFPEFRITTKDFNSWLVFGTSPIANDSWSGLWRGLALYGQELSARQVARHYETWNANGEPDYKGDEHPLALYLFNEHEGRVVLDHGSSRTNLYIPERYQILRERFLEPPWEEYRDEWSYWEDVLINIGGFVPVGLVFCAYFTSVLRMGHPAVLTAIFGVAVSLTIEVSQAYLPTRNSGVTDIITNTLGTGLGIALYRWNSALFVKALNRIRIALFS